MEALQASVEAPRRVERPRAGTARGRDGVWSDRLASMSKKKLEAGDIGNSAAARPSPTSSPPQRLLLLVRDGVWRLTSLDGDASGECLVWSTSGHITGENQRRYVTLSDSRIGLSTCGNAQRCSYAVRYETPCQGEGRRFESGRPLGKSPAQTDIPSHHLVVHSRNELGLVHIWSTSLFHNLPCLGSK
jgi:hypothetical protein